MLRISRHFVGNGPRAVPRVEGTVLLTRNFVSKGPSPQHGFDKHCRDKLYYGLDGKKRLT